MRSTNPWCEALGIPVPRLEDARRSADANAHALLIVALLERGAPLTLARLGPAAQAGTGWPS